MQECSKSKKKINQRYCIDEEQNIQNLWRSMSAIPMNIYRYKKKYGAILRGNSYCLG